MRVLPYLLVPRPNTFGDNEVQNLPKNKLRTGPKPSCQIRLVGAATSHCEPWASVSACTLVCSVMAQPLGAWCPLQQCWGPSSGPSLSQTQGREKSREEDTKLVT